MAEIGRGRWRRMRAADLVGVERVADAVHPDHPEDAAVLAERLQLHPAGCLVLDGEQGIRGYAVAHPWRFGRPPPLNTPLGGLPARPDTFYIHDLALLPDARGDGAGASAVDLLARQAAAEGFTNISLVAVGGSQRFWRRNGFKVVEREETRAALASYGRADFMERVLPQPAP